jgi:hypothetical protein
MGCDGGSIPKRDELVHLQKKPEKVDQNELERIKWFSCAISKEPLRSPVVYCELGYLYNKEAIIKRLIEKTIPEAYSHIRSLKDVFPVNFQPNVDYKPTSEVSSLNVVDLAQESPFACPITGLLVGSNHKFSVLKSCGCAFADRALRECPSDVCLTCNTPFTAEDVMPLNPDEEQQKVLIQKMKDKRAGEKKEKKTKKSRSSTVATEQVSNGKRKIDTANPSTVITSTTTTSKPAPSVTESHEKLTKKAKVTTEEEKPLKVSTFADKKVYASIFTSSMKETTKSETFLCRNVARG